MNSVRTRFSPSPTGMIHLGNVRAALFSALFAAKHLGVFILRIEDTDVLRSEAQFVESLQKDLEWLGIDWQEGPNRSGEAGPYFQSQRQTIYEKFYQMMEAQRLIYPCFCTNQELNIARKIQLSRGQPPRYSGTCLKLTATEIADSTNAGLKPAWRYAVPANQTIEFTDIVKGPQLFQSNDLGDFIVRRPDGTPPFLYCNAIDDATMQITHVLRGEDHLANTPRQILLLQALNLSVPHYGHLSLIVGDDGAPLSKRHKSFSLQQIREEGYLPAAIINYLARLGHASDLPELASFEKLATHFSLEKLSRSSAHFDEVQLMHWQKLAIKSLDENDFWLLSGTDIKEKVPSQSRALFVATIKSNINFLKDAKAWAEIFFEEGLTYDEASLLAMREAGDVFFLEAKNAVEKFGVELTLVLAELKNKLNVQGKKLFTPLRAAFTGKINGPELASIFLLLGKEKSLRRLIAAYQKIEE